MTPRSRPLDITIELEWVAPTALTPNDYNPNVLDDELYGKAVASIRKYGFVDPVTARLVDDHYVIIDGEHRVRAALDLGLRLVPVIVVDVDEDTAQQLTLVLNELHGRPDRTKLLRLLQGLSERHPLTDLLETLPFAREQFMALTTVPGTLPHNGAAPPAARWVERMYRLPRESADVLDAALNRAKEFEELSEDWKALEAIARRYLES